MKHEEKSRMLSTNAASRAHELARAEREIDHLLAHTRPVCHDSNPTLIADMERLHSKVHEAAEEAKAEATDRRVF